jgi:peptide methionine sulfoxide reductase MsrA
MTHAASQGESLMSAEVHRVGFGGGCHWCTEAAFAALRGVIRVEQGFIRADAPDDNFSEAVLLTFRPEKISVGSLIEIHLRTHSSTSNHSMRRKYRSAVYALWPDRSMQPQAAHWQGGRSCAVFAIKGTWPATTKVSCRGTK